MWDSLCYVLIWESRFFFLCMLPRTGVSGREGILKRSGFVLKSNSKPQCCCSSLNIQRWSDLGLFILRAFAAVWRFSSLPKLLDALLLKSLQVFFLFSFLIPNPKSVPRLLFQWVQVGLRVCISDKFLGGSSVGAVGQETTFCQLLLYVIWVFPRVHGPELGTQCALNKCWLVHCI